LYILKPLGNIGLWAKDQTSVWMDCEMLECEWGWVTYEWKEE